MTIDDTDNDLRYRIVCKNTNLTKQQYSNLQNYMPLTLFSILLAVAISQMISCQTVSASNVLMDKGLSLDNVTSSSSSSTNNISEKDGYGVSIGIFPKVQAHMSGEKGIFANAYLVESANGVVVIDSALTVNESKGLIAQLDSIKKPLLAVLLTHPHPDHVAGVTYLVTPKTSSPSSSSSTTTPTHIPIISLESVERIMNDTEEAKRIQWTPIFKEEWISKWTYPDQNVKDKESVTFDGLTYRVHDLGPGGDSDANSVWILENEPKVAFVGDLVFNGHHPYIADDHIFDWLKNLERARDLLANVTIIHPGHGKSGSIELIDSQESYLLTYIDAVRELSRGNSTLTEEAKGELTQRMEKILPGGGLSFLIAQSADPVAAELARVAAGAADSRGF
jgi:glyoxylase-like metal-dependent hydrolase (beta-lactamase superfamily II)